MNYYRRYVGDYLRDTARLSMLEHGAYNLLLDYYYAEERPIPVDLDEVYRMVRAIMPEERRAVQKVLSTFFQRTDEAWHHKRVDHEIDVSRQARDNGKGGGRPRTGRQTGSETGIETGKVTGEGGGSGHPPTTNLQPPAAKPPTTEETAIAPSSFALDAGGPINGHDKADNGVERIPLCDGSDYPVPKAFRDELDRLYPAVDPDQTLREIRGWCLANPKRRKTARGVRSFITSWFSREQDRQSRRAA